MFRIQIRRISSLCVPHEEGASVSCFAWRTTQYGRGPSISRRASQEDRASADTETWAANALMYMEHLPAHVAVMQALRGMQGLPAIPD